jgi:hypothetical protein
MNEKSSNGFARMIRTLLKNPKTYFLAAAFISFLVSVDLWFSGHREQGIFVGLWVPSICSAGALILGGANHDR